MSKHWLLTRRRALWLGLGTAAFTGTLTADWLADQRNQSQVLGAEIGAGEPPLREIAAAKGIVYGASGRYQDLSSDAEYAAKFAKECGILVPGLALKWDAVHPSPDKYNFSKGDWMVEFARSHNMLVRGHTLVWNQAMPKWLKENLNPQNAEQLMREHIKTVVGHYAGKMHSWDVVNEAVYPQHGRADGLRKTPWLRALGEDYIDIAFRAAAEADPQALLVYNDNRMSNDSEDGEATRTSILKLLERLKSRGTPVQALGMEAHLLGKNESVLQASILRKFIQNVGDLGLKVMVTELDVKDNQMPADIKTRDRMVADVYSQYLRAVLNEKAVIAVLTWGLSDRYTWRSKYPRGDGASVRPLPLDAQLNRKLAWKEMARKFAEARDRR